MPAVLRSLDRLSFGRLRRSRHQAAQRLLFFGLRKGNNDMNLADWPGCIERQHPSPTELDLERPPHHALAQATANRSVG